MWYRNSLTLMGLLVAGLLFVAPPLQAQQECGGSCDTCALGLGFAGYAPGGGHLYDRLCYEEVPYCVACPPDLVDGFHSGVDVLKGLESADPSVLSQFVETLGARMLVSVERGLVVVKGASCDAEALAVTSFVGTDLASRIERLGVQSIETHLFHASISN